MCPRERLIDELWGDEPPPSAAKTLQVHVSRLRRELGEAVVTRGGGYLIEVEPGALDLDRFTQLADDGRRALAAGEPGRAEERLREALQLWRGPPFAELSDDAFARIEGERLADLRLDAMEERIEAELALGRQSEAIGELEALVARHPYRERPRAQLMLALYREGRQAEALEAYRDARSALVDGLGIEPGPRLQEMHRAILAQDPALDGVQRAPAASVPPTLARPPPRRRPGPRTLILAGAVALAAGFLVAALLDGDAHEDGPALTRDSHAVVAIDPATNEVTDVASVGARPGPLTFEPKSDSLWVANVDDRSVTRIDTRPLQVGRTIGVGATPGGLATADDAVWVATANRAKPFVTLSKIDPGFDALAGSVNIAAASEGTADVTSLGERLMVAPQLGLLTEVDPRTVAVARRGVEPGGLAPSAIAAGGGAIWVADEEGNTVSRIDAHSGAAKAIPVGNGPAGLAVGAGSVWVTLALDDRVARIDPETGAVRDTVRVGRRPAGVAIGGGAVWTANSGDGTVSRIDPSSGRVTATIAVGASPQDVAVGGDDRVWVSARPLVLPEPTRPAATLRVAAGPQSEPEAFTVDPALAYWFLPWQVLQATCAKLVNYPDEPGQAGIRLRPEVATSMPKRSADGLTYTFRIRRGYRFSPPSNEPVAARNFKYAIERSFNPRISGPLSALDIPIAGLREYTDRPSTADLRCAGGGREAGHPADTPARRPPDPAGDVLLLRHPDGHPDRSSRRACDPICGPVLHSVRGSRRGARPAPQPELQRTAAATVRGDPDKRSGGAERGSRARGERQRRLRHGGNHAAVGPKAGGPPPRAAVSDRSSAGDRLSLVQHRQAHLLVASAAPGGQSRHRSPTRSPRRAGSSMVCPPSRRISTCRPGYQALWTPGSIPSSPTSKEHAGSRDLSDGPYASTHPRAIPRSSSPRSSSRTSRRSGWTST